MKGIKPYDIIMLVGSMILTFIIVYWVMRYGTAQVSDLILETPSVLQDSAASYFSSICSFSGNITVTQEIARPYTMRVIYNSTHVQVRPAKEKYYFSEVERTGFMRVGTAPPIAWVGCGLRITPRGVSFDEKVHKDVLFNQTAGDIAVRVK